MSHDAPAALATGLQEPMTAQEHARANGLEAEYARDVPRTCTCEWLWYAAGRRYVPLVPGPWCHWHNAGRIETSEEQQ